jgi:hypothetical protein
MHRLAFAARALGLALVIVVASAAVALAAAGGAGTETLTEHHKEVVFIEPSKTMNPCTGEEGTITAIAANEKFHLTTHADGEMWATGTAEGTATFVPFGSGLSYSGHFAAWFGQAVNQKNNVEHETNTFVLRAANGSQVIVHMRSHLSTNAAGEVTAEFKEISAHCG